MVAMKKPAKEATKKMKKTSVNVDETLWREVKKRAIDEGRDVSDLLAEALALYLRRPVQEARR
jgi:hypothetical protein